MNVPSALSLLRNNFEAITGLPVDDWKDARLCNGPLHADALLSAGGKQFIVECKAAATTDQIGAALRQLISYAGANQGGPIPLLVVPYMGEAGQQLCRSAGISWLDLSGNAVLSAPPIHIRVLGEPNRFKRPGRPLSMFAPRSSRLARIFLLDPERSYAQTQLARESGLSPGFLSRLLPRYEAAGFVARIREGRTAQFSVRDPAGLLDAWRANYVFAGHNILRGHIAARTGPELLRELTANLNQRQYDYAATGLAAAWLWEPFAAFRLVTIYLRTWPAPVLLSELGFHEGERGSNTWLVVPNDEGVFMGTDTIDGVRCASAIQVYLDLKGHPERATEAAAELRRLCLS